MQKLPTVNFPGIEKANENMLAVAQGLRKQPMHIDIPLDNARSQIAGTALNVQIAGNMFYVDNNANDGIAIAHFQDQTLSGAAVPFTVGPGFMSRVPYTQIAIENAAQPGKKIRIIYGIDLDFVPSLSGQVQASILGTVPVSMASQADPLYNVYQSQYPSTSTHAANVAESIFSNGVNVNGAIVHYISFMSVCASAQIAKFVAATAAPATAAQPNPAICNVDNTSQIAGTVIACGKRDRSIFLPAGRGLWFITDTAETKHNSQVLYTLL